MRTNIENVPATNEKSAQRRNPSRLPKQTATRRAKDRSEFAGKVAVVTGGTSGIGAAAARRLAGLGAKVIIIGRRCLEGRRLISEIKSLGGCAAFLRADLNDAEQVRLVVPHALETFGRLDYAFNNAGTSGENRLLVDQTEENFNNVFAVNVKALFLLLQAEVKQMIAQGQGGSIVNAASVSGFVAIPTAGIYAASKHAVLGLTKAAAVEYGKYGIRVNAVSPGAVRTQMLLEAFGNEQALQQMASVHPLGRVGRPEEIADAVVWLFSDKSSYYTGQSLTLDGGLTALRPSMSSTVSVEDRSAGRRHPRSSDRAIVDQAVLQREEAGNGKGLGYEHRTQA